MERKRDLNGIEAKENNMTSTTSQQREDITSVNIIKPNRRFVFESWLVY